MRCRWSTYDFLDDRIRPSDKDADDGCVLIEFVGGTVAGSFVLPSRLCAHWDVKVSGGTVSLVHYPGTTIIVR